MSQRRSIPTIPRGGGSVEEVVDAKDVFWCKRLVGFRASLFAGNMEVFKSMGNNLGGEEAILVVVYEGGQVEQGGIWVDDYGYGKEELRVANNDAACLVTGHLVRKESLTPAPA